jgi:hypothetical protein
VVQRPGEPPACLQAEADENTCRKAFDPMEAVAMGDAIEKAYRPVAEEKLKTAGSDGGKKAGKGRPSDRPRGTSPTPKPQDESARTTAVAAAAVGMDRLALQAAENRRGPTIDRDATRETAGDSGTWPKNVAHDVAFRPRKRDNALGG